MISIVTGSSNDVVLNLTSNSQAWVNSGITPYYLFEFTSANLNSSIYFVGVNVSSATSRYDEFYIIETGSTYTNLSASTLSLWPGMQWSYTVYEQPYPIQFNFNPNLCVGVVDNGLVLVSGFTAYNPVVYTNAATSQFLTYRYSNQS